MLKGKILVISGPSGVGKTTLYRRLLAEYPGKLSFSVSATTRNRRSGEQNGRDYYFISQEEFQKHVNSNDFVEWARVHNNSYGTLKSEIERITSSGENCLLDVDVQGGMNIRKSFPEAVMIFIAPPSLDELKRRITLRNTDNPESIFIRMEDAFEEMKFAKEYNHQIINTELEQAYSELKKLVLSVIV